MRECPKREKVNAIMAECPGDREDGTTRVNPLQLLGALQTEKATSSTPYGLMYVSAVINRREVSAMIDFDATNNFVAARVVDYLGLELHQNSSKIKVVNSKAQPIRGSTVAEMRVGPWEGRVDLMVVPLDDFDIILGIDFLITAKCMVMPHLGGLMIIDKEMSGFVKAINPCSGREGSKKVGIVVDSTTGGRTTSWQGDILVCANKD